MGFFDSLIGRHRNRKREPPAVLELRISDCAPLLSGRREGREEKFALRAGPLISNLKSETGGLASELEEFFSKPVSIDDQRARRIAQSMMENYSQRLSTAFAEVITPEKTTVETAISFGALVRQSLTLLEKTTSDNRYLAVFFKEEFEALGGKIRTVVSQLSELEAAIAAEKKSRLPLSNAVDSLDAYLKCIDGEKSVASDIESLTAEMHSLDGKIGLRAGAGSKKSAAEAAAGDAEESLSRARSEAFSKVAPLERLFRRFERATADKALASAARAYSGDPLSMLLREDPGLPRIKALCGSALAMLDEGRLASDSKHAGREREMLRAILDGGLDPSVPSIRAGMGCVSEARGVLEALSSGEAELRALVLQRGGVAARLAQSAEARKAAWAATAAAKAALASNLSELENRPVAFVD
ncbi:MAG: hypothetical protein V1787_00060 [Candidatus Micrarchaeota archaeon]